MDVTIMMYQSVTIYLTVKLNVPIFVSDTLTDDTCINIEMYSIHILISVWYWSHQIHMARVLGCELDSTP